MQEFNIDEFDKNYHDKNLVIEASAGTGKTYSITQIVKNLVEKHNVDINKILIVTYTEKATGELKHRIRKEIEDIVENKNDLDNLNIYTIHSFSQNAIKEFGLKAELPLQMNVIDEKNEISEFFDRFVRENSIISNDLNKLLVTTKYETVRSVFVDATLKYYLDFKYNTVEDIITLSPEFVIDEFLNEYVESFLNNNLSNFEDFRNAFKDFSDAYNALNSSANQDVHELIESVEANYNSSTELLKVIDYDGSNFRINNSKLFVTQEEKDAIKVFKKYKEIKIDSKAFVTNYINIFYKAWQEEKQKNKKQTYNDMLRNIREVLLNEEEPYLFKKALQEKYEYAIIDEFQDTNQLQFDTFKKIFMEDSKHHIIVVGDPKQSIYSFQGADLNVYQKAKKEIIDNGGRQFLLSYNYRSSKRLIESCNLFFKENYFSEKKENEGNDENEHEEFNNEIRFRKSDSPDGNKLAAKIDGEEVKSFWIGNSSDSTGIVAYSYAELVAEKIVEWCSYDKNKKTKLQLVDKYGQERNVSFEDFAILAKSRSEMIYMERVLKKCGIPYVKYKDNSLFNGRECANWIALLEALNSVDFTGVSRSKFRKALFTDFFDRSLAEINSKYFERDDCKEMQLINKWKTLAAEGKWEKLFDDIMMDSEIMYKLKSLDNLQSLIVYKQISEYCVSYLYEKHTLDDLINRLNLANLIDEDDDSNIVGIGTDFACVKLMTIHASKGLQFPIVISLAGFKGPNNQIKTCVYHDDEGKRKISLGSIKGKKDSQDEWKRLIYVCYTRAKYINIIPYYSEIHNKRNYYLGMLKKAMDNYMEKNADDFQRLDYPEDDINLDDLRSNVSRILEEYGKADDKDESNKEKDSSEYREALIKKEGSLKSYKHSYSSLSHGSNENEEELEDEEREKEGYTDAEFDLSEFDNKSKQIASNVTDDDYAPYDSFPRGSTIGTALHEVFENIDFTDYANNLDDVIVERLEANRIAKTPELINYTKGIVTNVLNASFPEIHGDKPLGSFALNTIKNEDKKPEIEFNFNLKDEKLKNYCNGFIDLLFKRGEYYSILDWKSDTLNDDFTAYNNLTELKKHTDERYSIQRVLYSYCLIKWLKNCYDESEENIFKKHFGGIYYVYIRGCKESSGNGIYAQTWNSYKELEEAFNNIVRKKVGR